MASDEEIKRTERIFQYWLTELRQRESSNITVVAITSSASLVMLALFGDITRSGINDTAWLVFVVGILFSAFGLVYRELSEVIMHEHQITELAMLMSVEEIEKKEAMRVYARREHNWRRELIWRIIMLTPSASWIVAIVTVYYKDLNLTIIALTIMLIASTIVIACLDNNDRKKSRKEGKRLQEWLKERNDMNRGLGKVQSVL